MEGLDIGGLTNSGPDLLPALQLQMESQLPADTGMRCRVTGSQFMQSSLSRQLILSNAQIQQTNPQADDRLGNANAISQVGINLGVRMCDQGTDVVRVSDRVGFDKTLSLIVDLKSVHTPVKMADFCDLKYTS